MSFRVFSTTAHVFHHLAPALPNQPQATINTDLWCAVQNFGAYQFGLPAIFSFEPEWLAADLRSHMASTQTCSPAKKLKRRVSHNNHHYTFSCPE